MDNKAISKILRNIAVAYTIKDENKYRFQIIAYRNASEAIETMTTQVRDLYGENRLDTIPAVGASIRTHLTELFKTGHVAQFDELLKELPSAMFPLLDIPSFGPKKAYKLVAHFNLENSETVIEDLEQLSKENKIAELEGFGKKSQDLILQAISEFKAGKAKGDRMPLPFASEIAEKIIEYMKTNPHVQNIFPLGSLRRKLPTIGDVDLAVATDSSEEVISHFINYPYIERLLQQGKNEANFLTAGGVRVDLRTMPKESFGSLLQHFTGSKNHNVALREYALSMNLSLSEYGIKDKEKPEAPLKTYETEEAFYEALSLSWIPPEIRENTGEIEQAKKHALPKLVELADIKGDFHIHSNFPIEPSHDLGADSFETMLKHAAKLGYEYLGFSEHNPSVSRHTAEQIYELIEKRNKFIDQIKFGDLPRVIKLLETDILAEGTLGVDEKSLELLDATIVSIHSSFAMDKETMTKRIIKGLSHPKAKIFAHPTTRLINQRNGINADWQEIFSYCKEHDKALEINAAPQRLDLPDTMVHDAIKVGVKFVINTDSHNVESMDLMQYGISVARRGWATKHDILNTLSYNELMAWLSK